MGSGDEIDHLGFDAYLGVRAAHGKDDPRRLQSIRKLHDSGETNASSIRCTLLPRSWSNVYLKRCDDALIKQSQHSANAGLLGPVVSQQHQIITRRVTHHTAFCGPEGEGQGLVVLILAVESIAVTIEYDGGAAEIAGRLAGREARTIARCPVNRSLWSSWSMMSRSLRPLSR
jgi:hypothetical protein